MCDRAREEKRRKKIRRENDIRLDANDTGRCVSPFEGIVASTCSPLTKPS